MEWESISTVHAFRPRLSSVWANSSLRQRVYLAGPLEAFPPNCGTYGWTRRLLPYSSASGRGTRIHPSSPQHYFVCPPPSFLPSFLPCFLHSHSTPSPTCQVPSANQAVNAEPQLDHFPPLHGAQQFDCPQRDRGRPTFGLADSLRDLYRKEIRGEGRRYFTPQKQRGRIDLVRQNVLVCHVVASISFLLAGTLALKCFRERSRSLFPIRGHPSVHGLRREFRF